MGVLRNVVTVVACAVTACGGAQGDDGGSTMLIASFGDDTGPTTVDPTGATTMPATLTDDGGPASNSVSDSADPTTNPTTEATDPSSTTDPTNTTDPTDDEGSSSGEEPPPPVCASIEATIRDFASTHVDMSNRTTQSTGEIEPGLVLDTLGDDGKPVYDITYAGDPVVFGPDSFAEWYNDVADVNVAISVSLDLYEESPGRTVFVDNTFFPIDDLGFGNEGKTHNFYFTTEIHTTVRYEGGEVMSFGGDDDVWVFVDGHLVADVGGKHSLLTVDVALDDLGLVPGMTYPLDVFHAERGEANTNLRFELGGFCKTN